ncbi:MAG: hypothetical protein DRN53_04015, partial [Thermoprotei archaeon]
MTESEEIEKPTYPKFFIPLAIIIAIIAIGLCVWGTWTFFTKVGEIWKAGPQVWIWGAAFLSPGYTFWLIVGALVWIPITILFFMELLGYTIKGGKITRQIIKWDAIDVSVAALCAAIYGGGLTATGGLAIIPGFTWIRPANCLSALFGVLFGIPGCIGCAVGNFIADALAGYLSVGSIGGFIGNFLIAYIPYKLMKDQTFRSARSIFEFYLWGVLVGSLLCAIYIGWWLDIAEPFIGLPPLFIWGWFVPWVTINNGLVTAIVSPVLGFVLYPMVKKWGLHWT